MKWFWFTKNFFGLIQAFIWGTFLVFSKSTEVHNLNWIECNNIYLWHRYDIWWKLWQLGFFYNNIIYLNIFNVRWKGWLDPQPPGITETLPEWKRERDAAWSTNKSTRDPNTSIKSQWRTGKYFILIIYSKIIF